MQIVDSAQLGDRPGFGEKHVSGRVAPEDRIRLQPSPERTIPSPRSGPSASTTPHDCFIPRAPRRRRTLHTQMPVASTIGLGPALGDKHIPEGVALDDRIRLKSLPERASPMPRI
jgi:hypothetical protein